MHKKTLKRTRKFVVDGVEVSVTTSKIISEDEKKDEEMRFLRQVGHWAGGRAGCQNQDRVFFSASKSRGDLKSSHFLSWYHLDRTIVQCGRHYF